MKSDETIFSFFYSLFSGEYCIWSPLLLLITDWFSLDASGETTSWITSICSFVQRLMVYFTIHKKSEGTFSAEICSSKTVFILLLHGVSIHLFFWTLFLFFFVNFFYLSTRFLSLLNLQSSVIFNPVSIFLPWMLFTMNKLKHQRSK